MFLSSYIALSNWIWKIYHIDIILRPKLCQFVQFEISPSMSHKVLIFLKITQKYYAVNRYIYDCFIPWPTPIVNWYISVVWERKYTTKEMISIFPHCKLPFICSNIIGEPFRWSSWWNIPDGCLSYQEFLDRGLLLTFLRIHWTKGS